MRFYLATVREYESLLCLWILVFCVTGLSTNPAASRSHLFDKPNDNTFAIIAKTKETFKFSDLQLLEAQIEAKTRNHEDVQCLRLLLDAATGASLILWQIQVNQSENVGTNLKSTYFINSNIPLCLRQCEWVAELISHGETAQGLLESLNKMGGASLPTSAGWTLDYTRMSPSISQEMLRPVSRNQTHLGYTMKTLLCAVAQKIQTPAALDPTNASDEFQIIETATQQIGIFLCRVLFRECKKSVNVRLNPTMKEIWDKRPFQYSSAIHPMVAEKVVNMLFNLILQDRQRQALSGTPASSEERSIRLLDATCGSGTFLAFALQDPRLNVSVVGFDVNSACIDGTKRNLEHVFGATTVKERCQLLVRDSSVGLRSCDKISLRGVDCVVTNLPWGKNTIDYMNQNMQILRSLHEQLRSGVPCVFVHKDSKLSYREAWGKLGFEVQGEAFVPPLNFKLPNSKKQKGVWNDEENTDTVSSQNLDPKDNQRITVVKTI